MLKALSIAITTLALAGCASTSAWRDLEIDGSSQASIDESVSMIQRELPEWRREQFDMVLADLWITGQIASGAEGDDFSEREYRALLDGLRYEDVLDLAGPDTTPRYWAVARVRGGRSASGAGQAWSGTDPNRFPTYVAAPPGLAASQ